MSITVVVGAQFGGEGKGKVADYLATKKPFDAIVRCGGPNSGHTVVRNGRVKVLRQLPAAVVNSDSTFYIPAGGLIDVEVLNREIKEYGVTTRNLRIDRNALVLDAVDAQSELAVNLRNRIGSTCTGTGVGVAKRVMRGDDVRLAQSVSGLAGYVTDVSAEVSALERQGARVLVEGTQGFGLSLYHADCFPFATSRDTSAAAFLSEAGLSPMAVEDIVLVVRTFPIRVEGNSGPLPDEIDWTTMQRESGYPYEVEETTSVTGRSRRIARFSSQVVARAAAANRPTMVAITGLDYLDFSVRGCNHIDALPPEVTRFISDVESICGASALLLGTGPDAGEIIDLVGAP